MRYDFTPIDFICGCQATRVQELREDEQVEDSIGVQFCPKHLAMHGDEEHWNVPDPGPAVPGCDCPVCECFGGMVGYDDYDDDWQAFKDAARIG